MPGLRNKQGFEGLSWEQQTTNRLNHFGSEFAVAFSLGIYLSMEKFAALSRIPLLTRPALEK